MPIVRYYYTNISMVVNNYVFGFGVLVLLKDLAFLNRLRIC